MVLRVDGHQVSWIGQVRIIPHGVLPRSWALYDELAQHAIRCEWKHMRLLLRAYHVPCVRWRGQCEADLGTSLELRVQYARP